MPEMRWYLSLWLARFSWLKRPSSRRDLIAFVRGVINEFLSDNCPHLAASISYYLLLSFFPLILALVSVVGFVLRSSTLQNRLIEYISSFLPVSGNFIAQTIQGVSSAWQATGIISVVGLLWAGSAVFSAIRKSVNTAWGIRQPRPFFIERLTELLMMIGMGFLLFLSFSLTTALSVVRQLSLPVLGIHFFDGDLLWQAALALLTTSLAFVTFLFLYRFIPNARVRWRDIWPGALAAAILFEIAKQAFVWYTTTFAHYNLIYGPIGAIIALLVWVYISALILLFCAKLTSVYSRQRFWAAEAEKGEKGQAQQPTPVLLQFEPSKEKAGASRPSWPSLLKKWRGFSGP